VGPSARIFMVLEKESYSYVLAYFTYCSFASTILNRYLFKLGEISPSLDFTYSSIPDSLSIYLSIYLSILNRLKSEV